MVQQRQAPAVQLAGSGRADRHEREAERAAAPSSAANPSTFANGSTLRASSARLAATPRLLRREGEPHPGLPDVHDRRSGVNPINMSRGRAQRGEHPARPHRVHPWRPLITQALDNYGVFDKAGALGRGADRGARHDRRRRSSDGARTFIDSLSWRDIFHLGDVWDRAKRIFTEPIDRLIDFAASVVAGILEFDQGRDPAAARRAGRGHAGLGPAERGARPGPDHRRPRAAHRRTR